MFRMALARLQERIELLENQIKENEIIELHNAQQKLNNDKCKKKMSPNFESVYCLNKNEISFITNFSNLPLGLKTLVEDRFLL